MMGTGLKLRRFMNGCSGKPVQLSIQQNALLLTAGVVECNSHDKFISDPNQLWVNEPCKLLHHAYIFGVTDCFGRIRIICVENEILSELFYAVLPSSNLYHHFFIPASPLILSFQWVVPNHAVN